MLHHRTAEEKKLARLLEEVTGLGDEYDPKAEVHDDDNHPSVVRACLPYLDGSNAVIVSGKTSGPIRSSLKRHNSALSPPSTSTVGKRSGLVSKHHVPLRTSTPVEGNKKPKLLSPEILHTIAHFKAAEAVALKSGGPLPPPTPAAGAALLRSLSAASVAASSSSSCSSSSSPAMTVMMPTFTADVISSAQSLVAAAMHMAESKAGVKVEEMKKVCGELEQKYGALKEENKRQADLIADKDGLLEHSALHAASLLAELTAMRGERDALKRAHDRRTRGRLEAVNEAIGDELCRAMYRERQQGEEIKRLQQIIEIQAML